MRKNKFFFPKEKEYTPLIPTPSYFFFFLVPRDCRKKTPQSRFHESQHGCTRSSRGCHKTASKCIMQHLHPTAAKRGCVLGKRQSVFIRTKCSDQRATRKSSHCTRLHTRRVRRKLEAWRDVPNIACINTDSRRAARDSCMPVHCTARRSTLHGAGVTRDAPRT